MIFVSLKLLGNSVANLSNLHRTTIISGVLLLILTIILPNTFAQSDDLSSVLEKAQKALTSKNNTNSNTLGQVMKLPPIPTGADIFVQTKLTLTKDSFSPTNISWVFPIDTTFLLSKGNKLCPANNCSQEYHEADLDRIENRMYMSGVLKIEDPVTSTAEFKNWNIYQVSGWAMDITKVQEDTKNRQTNYFFDGLFGIGKHGGSSDPDALYEVIGTFQEPSGKLQFAGKYITFDQFISKKRD